MQSQASERSCSLCHKVTIFNSVIAFLSDRFIRLIIVVPKFGSRVGKGESPPRDWQFREDPRFSQAPRRTPCGNGEILRSNGYTCLLDLDTAPAAVLPCETWEMHIGGA